MNAEESTKQEILERIQRLESPTARRVIGRIAGGILSGRIGEQDAELIAGLAEHMAASNMLQAAVGTESLTVAERDLLESFRSLTPRQQEGARMMLHVFKPIS